MFNLTTTTMKSEVIWRTIPMFGNRYEASNYGDVRSVSFTTMRSHGRPYTHKGRVLVQVLDRDGYKRVQISVDGKRHLVPVHKLVYSAFLGNIPEGLVIDHINNNRADNRLENLNAISNWENHQKDSWRHRKIDLPIGVYYQAGRAMFTASIRINNTYYYLGSFKTIAEAKDAYDTAEKKYKESGLVPSTSDMKRVRNMHKDGHKVCPCCGRNLPISDYYLSSGAKTNGQRQAKCKECVKEYERNRRNKLKPQIP